MVKERIAIVTPARCLMRTMFAGVAEFECDRIAARTTDGRNVRGRKDGERGGRVRYGYRRCDGEIHVDALAAAIVKRLFGCQRRGWTLPRWPVSVNTAAGPVLPAGTSGRPADG